MDEVAAVLGQASTLKPLPSPLRFRSKASPNSTVTPTPQLLPPLTKPHRGRVYGVLEEWLSREDHSSETSSDRSPLHKKTEKTLLDGKNLLPRDMIQCMADTMHAYHTTVHALEMELFGAAKDRMESEWLRKALHGERSRLERYEETMRALQSRVCDVEPAKRPLQDTVDEAELLALRKKHEILENSYAVVISENSNLTEVINKLRKENEDNKRDMYLSEKRVERAEDTNNELRKKINNLRDELNKTNETFTQQISQLKKNEEKVKKLAEDSQNKWKQKTLQLTDDLAKVSEQSAAQVAKLESHLSEVKVDLSNALSDNSKVKSEVSSLRSTLEECSVLKAWLTVFLEGACQLMDRVHGFSWKDINELEIYDIAKAGTTSNSEFLSQMEGVCSGLSKLLNGEAALQVQVQMQEQEIEDLRQQQKKLLETLGDLREQLEKERELLLRQQQIAQQRQNQLSQTVRSLAEKGCEVALESSRVDEEFKDQMEDVGRKLNLCPTLPNAFKQFLSRMSNQQKESAARWKARKKAIQEQKKTAFEEALSAFGNLNRRTGEEGKFTLRQEGVVATQDKGKKRVADKRKRQRKPDVMARGAAGARSQVDASTGAEVVASPGMQSLRVAGTADTLPTFESLVSDGHSKAVAPQALESPGSPCNMDLVDSVRALIGDSLSKGSAAIKVK